MSYRYDQISIQRMSGIDKKLMSVAMRAQLIASRRKEEYTIEVDNLGGARTDDEQALLFKEGKSEFDGIKRKSPHQKSAYIDEVVKCVDLIPVILRPGRRGNRIYASETKEVEREKAFNFVATCVLQAASELGVKVQWGGNIPNGNKNHYQMI